jgi:hypothetical protein
MGHVTRSADGCSCSINKGESIVPLKDVSIYHNTK